MQKIFSIGNKNTCPPTGEFILIDTSVLLELVGYDEQTLRTEEVKDFFTRLAYNNNIITTSVKTWEELNIILGRKLPKDKRNLFNNSNGFTNLYQKVEIVKETFNALPNVYSEPIGVIDNEIINKAQENAVKYKLKWGDSTIVSIAEREDVEHIWSLDCDYANVNNGMNIYLDSRSYNKALRINKRNTSIKGTAK